MCVTQLKNVWDDRGKRSMTSWDHNGIRIQVRGINPEIDPSGLFLSLGLLHGYVSTVVLVPLTMTRVSANAEQHVSEKPCLPSGSHVWSSSQKYQLSCWSSSNSQISLVGSQLWSAHHKKQTARNLTTAKGRRSHDNSPRENVWTPSHNWRESLHPLPHPPKLHSDFLMILPPYSPT